MERSCNGKRAQGGARRSSNDSCTICAGPFPTQQTSQAQIAKKVHTRQGKATTNFARALPSPQSSLAQVGAFKPEHAGKMSFYLSAVGDLLKHKDDQPRNRVQVEYALRDIQKPIGVAEWETRIVERLPKSLKGSLPTVEEIEAELAPKRRK